MNMRSVSQDDVQDLIELTKKLEESILDILKGNEHSTALSALIITTIRCMIIPCKTPDEAEVHRNLFMKMFDFSIKDVFYDPEKD